MTMRVTVMIPTQRRPGGLSAAVRSVIAQRDVDLDGVELLVVDNDQTPSAQALVAGMAASAGCAVRYVHEPKPGVASARNAGMAASSGAFIAFLDDDEEAPDHWLATLLRAQEQHDADVVFGPVRGRVPDHVVEHRAYLERFFSREGPAQAGLIDNHYGCGNSLIRRTALPDPVAPFALERDLTGGEDDLLFCAMRATGARFAWAPDAWVWEDPASERLNLDYAISRAFAYGQGPTNDCATAVPPDRVGVARWMAVGLAQTVLYGAVAGVLFGLRARGRAYWLDRAARGLGKLLWWDAFQRQFYGRTVAQTAGNK